MMSSSRDRIIESTQYILIYNELLVDVKRAKTPQDLIAQLERKMATVRERRDKVVTMLKYIKHVTGLAERPVVLEEHAAAKFTAKGAKLANAVLACNLPNIVDIYANRNDSKDGAGATASSFDIQARGSVKKE